MNYFSKIFVLSFFCMCALNCSSYGMESGGEVAPEAANSSVVAESLPTPVEEKSENEKKSDSDAGVKQDDEAKPDNEDKDKDKTEDETKSSDDEKSNEDSSNVVGKITVNVTESESSMDYYIVYDEDGNVVEIKDAKDSSDDSDERCKERVKSYSYSQEIIYYRS